MPLAIITGGLSVAGAIFGAKEANDQRKDAERQAQREFDLAERELDEIQAIRESDQRRFDQNFLPIEDRIARELNRDDDREGAARLAGDTFANQFDVANEAQERQLRQFGIRPDSQAFARATEDQAFNRAAGIASAQNHARREEEDRHFAQQLSFLGGGSNLQSQISNSLNNSYGIRSQNSAGYAADAANSASAVGQFGSLALGGIRDTIGAVQNRQSGQNPNNQGSNSNNLGQAAGGFAPGPATQSPQREVMKQVNP